MARKPAKEKPFKTEAELCARFIAAIGDAWTAYAETAGWDILLVRKTDGFQIGIEAKLKFNVDVVTQALESSSWNADGPGPDCRAVLVPDGDGRLGVIAAYIGLTVITVRPVGGHRYDPVFRPELPLVGKHWPDVWYEWAPGKRHKLPDYVPDVAAGAPAPVQLTDWKISAIKIAITLKRRGYVTRQDFRHIGIDHRRWIARETCWLQVSDGKYLAGSHLPNFEKMHPRVWAEIEADADKWMATDPGLLQQPTMV